MAGTKSIASRWCMLRDSETLKAAIKHRIKTMGLSTTDLAHMSNVSRTRVSAYLNSPHWDKNPGAYVTQRDVIGMCTVLGIDVELQIRFTQDG